METVRLDTWSQIVLTIIAVAQLLTLAVLVGVVVFVMKKLKSIASDTVDGVLEKTLPKIQPTLDHVNDATARVSDLVDKVSPKVARIADDSESAVHSVSEKVKTTSNIVTENVAKPIVNIASLLTGVQRGLEVWQTARTTQHRHTGNGAGSASVVDDRVTADPDTLG